MTLSLAETILNDETGAAQGQSWVFIFVSLGSSIWPGIDWTSFNYSLSDSYGVIHLFSHLLIHSFIHSVRSCRVFIEQQAMCSTLEILGQRKDMAPALQGLMV